jgi:hypothetical protein
MSRIPTRGALPYVFHHSMASCAKAGVEIKKNGKTKNDAIKMDGAPNFILPSLVK